MCVEEESESVSNNLKLIPLLERDWWIGTDTTSQPTVLIGTLTYFQELPGTLRYFQELLGTSRYYEAL